jgi:NADH-quinone oxidoreductase subunit H
MNGELVAVSPLAAYLGSFLTMEPPAWALVGAAVVLFWFVFLLPSLAAINYLDRKLGADIQMRIGPNRVSAYGFAQIVADTVKALFKEDSGTASGEPVFFKWGVTAAILCVFLAATNIPIAESWAVANQDSGVVFVIAALALRDLCVFWAAYSAESAWSVLSAFRAISVIASSTVPVALGFVPPVLISGALSFDSIVRAQGGAPWRWNLFHDPGSFLAFGALFWGLFVWQGRAPFDACRGSGELAGGYAAEQSGLRRGLTRFLDYISLYLASALVVTTYLGGWQTPFSLESFGRAANIVQYMIFAIKALALVFLSIWIRWSMPRLRVDQIMSLSWRFLVPLALLGSGIAGIWLVAFNGKGIGDFL